MEQILAQFYRDDETRKAVQSFIMTHLADTAARNAFMGESTAGIKDAKKAIENAFAELESRFGLKKKKKVDNQAR